VNATLEHLAACKKLLRVEVEAPAVDSAFEETTREFVKLARLPGFRPGKAPRHLVAKAFEHQISEEVRRKLVTDHLRDALRENKLTIVGRPDIEEIQFGRGQAFQFAATLETAPEFELPEYRGLRLKREVRTVTEEDIQRALRLLQEERVTYVDVQRPVQSGDFAVVNYTATCDGKPLTDLAPSARGLTEKQEFWLEIGPETFIPGFAEQLVGANAGEQRTVEVDFPPDFVTPQLAGRHGVYAVEVVQVKEKVVPEMNDNFARLYGAESAEALVAGVRQDLENELVFKMKRSTRDQLVQELLGRVSFDLPESIVTRETRNVVYDIVRENTERGISRQAIDQQKDQIFSVANNSARERVKASFVLDRIAEKEGIKADPKEVTQRIILMARQHNMQPEKLAKQLQDRNGLQEIEHQIVASKVLDLLEQHAAIEEVLPPGGTPAV
jgi:trigger factor